MRECRETGAGGEGLAVAGLALGYLGLATFVVPLVLVSALAG